MDVDLRYVLTRHELGPSSPEELRTLAGEMEEGLIAHECQFSHPDWRHVDGLRALAEYLDGLKAYVAASPPQNGEVK